MLLNATDRLHETRFNINYISQNLIHMQNTKKAI